VAHPTSSHDEAVQKQDNKSTNLQGKEQHFNSGLTLAISQWLMKTQFG
jgi:hypothetical protein